MILYRTKGTIIKILDKKGLIESPRLYIPYLMSIVLKQDQEKPVFIIPSSIGKRTASQLKEQMMVNITFFLDSFVSSESTGLIAVIKELSIINSSDLLSVAGQIQTFKEQFSQWYLKEYHRTYAWTDYDEKYAIDIISKINQTDKSDDAIVNFLNKINDPWLLSHLSIKLLANKYNEILSTRNMKFIKPDREEIKLFVEKDNLNVNPDEYYDYYEARDWYLGTRKMNDWKANIRTWHWRNINKQKSKETENERHSTKSQIRHGEIETNSTSAKDYKKTF